MSGQKKGRRRRLPTPPSEQQSFSGHPRFRAGARLPGFADRQALSSPGVAKRDRASARQLSAKRTDEGKRKLHGEAPHPSSGLRETPDATFPQGKADRRGGDEGTLSGRTQRHTLMASPGVRPGRSFVSFPPAGVGFPWGKLSAKLTDEGKSKFFDYYMPAEKGTTYETRIKAAFQ